MITGSDTMLHPGGWRYRSFKARQSPRSADKPGKSKADLSGRQSQNPFQAVQQEFSTNINKLAFFNNMSRKVRQHQTTNFQQQLGAPHLLGAPVTEHARSATCLKPNNPMSTLEAKERKKQTQLTQEYSGHFCYPMKNGSTL